MAYKINRMNTIQTLRERHAFKKRALLATTLLVGYGAVTLIPNRAPTDFAKQAITLKAIMFYTVVVALKMVKLVLEAYRLNKPVYRHRYNSNTEYLIAYYFHLRLELLYKFVAGLFGLYCVFLSYEAYMVEGTIMSDLDDLIEPESKRINLAFTLTKLINYAGSTVFSLAIVMFVILYAWVSVGGPIKFIH